MPINQEYNLLPGAQLEIPLDRWSYPSYAISLEVGDEIAIETTLHQINQAAEQGIPASGLLTLAAVPDEDDTFTIGSIVYRMRDTGNLAQDYDILNGATAADTQQNIIDCINGTGTPGTQYFAGTPTNLQVQSQLGTTVDTIDVVARSAGAAGNSIVTVDDFAGGDGFADGTLLGGLNGEDIPIWAPAFGRWENGDPVALDAVTVNTIAFIQGPVEALRITAGAVVCHGRIMQTGAT